MDEEYEAQFWQIVKSAEEGDRAAMSMLGMWLMRLGQSEPQTPLGIREEAYRWYMRSIEAQKDEAEGSNSAEEVFGTDCK
jgi:hypothetical protein